MFIEAADPPTSEFTARILRIVDEDIFPYYQSIDDDFRLTRALIPDAADMERFSAFLTDDIPCYQKEHTELRLEYFYGGLDRGCNRPFFPIGLLPAVARLPDGISTFLAGQSSTRKCFEDFVFHTGMNVGYFRLVPLAFSLLWKDSFPLLRQAHLKVGDSVANDFDFACALSFAEFLLANLQLWFAPLILSENEEAQVAVRHIVAILVPHELFGPFKCFPTATHQREFRKFEVELRPADDAMLAGAIARVYRREGFTSQSSTSSRRRSSSTSPSSPARPWSGSSRSPPRSESS
jgi:hypothetical protein